MIRNEPPEPGSALSESTLSAALDYFFEMAEEMMTAPMPPPRPVYYMVKPQDLARARRIFREIKVKTQNQAARRFIARYHAQARRKHAQ